MENQSNEIFHGLGSYDEVIYQQAINNIDYGLNHLSVLFADDEKVLNTITNNQKSKDFLVFIYSRIQQNFRGYNSEYNVFYTSMAWVREYLKSDYKPWINFLCHPQLRLIRRQGWYETGKNGKKAKSFDYYFFEYEDKILMNYSYNYKPVQNRIDKLNQFQLFECEFQIQLFNKLQEFRIDFKGSVGFLNKELNSKNEDEEKEKRNFILELSKVRRIDEGEWYLSQCEYGRIHTNMTNLKSEVKEGYIYHPEYDSLTQIDIVSAQPRMVQNVLEKNMDLTSIAVQSELMRFNSWLDRDIYQVLADIYEECMSSAQLRKKYGMRRILEYKLRYEKLKRQGKSPRKLAKIKFIMMLFDKYTTGHGVKEDRNGFRKSEEMPDLYLIFRGEFPLISKFISDYKAKLREIPKETKNEHQKPYEQLAHEMQRKESQVLRKLLVDVISLGIPFYTVHDSITVPTEFTDIVIMLFYKALASYNIKAKLDVKQLEFKGTRASQSNSEDSHLIKI